MLHWSNFLFFIFTVLTFEVQCFGGKYKIIMEKMGECEGPEFANIEAPLRNVKWFKVNRTAKSLSFDITFKRPVDKNIGGLIKTFKMINGRLLEVPFLPVVQNPCQIFMISFKDFWIDFMKHLGVLHPDECPIPAGNYSLTNYMFSEIVLPTILPVSGKIISQAILVDLQSKKPITCVETFAHHQEIIVSRSLI